MTTQCKNNFVARIILENNEFYVAANGDLKRKSEIFFYIFMCPLWKFARKTIEILKFEIYGKGRVEGDMIYLRTIFENRLSMPIIAFGW